MKHWSAFCTMYWFATGSKIIADSNPFVIAQFYGWYLRRIDK